MVSDCPSPATFPPSPDCSRDSTDKAVESQASLYSLASLLTALVKQVSPLDLLRLPRYWHRQEGYLFVGSVHPGEVWTPSWTFDTNGLLTHAADLQEVREEPSYPP